ncbi:MAG: tRNA lysidine(34) synthetase TilS, partial [Actinomycetota bacterium]
VEESRCKTQALAATVLTQVPEGISASRTAVSALKPAEVPALLKAALQAIGAEPRARYLALLGANLDKPGFSLDLPEGRCAWIEGDALLMGSKPKAPRMTEAPLAVGGSTRAEGWGLVFEIDRVPVPLRFSGDPFEAVVDEALLRPPVSVRPWLPGDRFVPLGAPGSKKLQDFFTDAAVPRRARPCVPILVSAGRIAWVAGHRIDERFKITPQTACAVRIRVRSA